MIRYYTNQEVDLRTSPLRQRYLEMRERIESEEDVKKEDITQLFWYHVEVQLKEKELINIHIRGQVATGKSTAAMAIAIQVNKFLKNHEIVKEFNKYIKMDQREFIRFIRDAPTNLCIVIDENNNMLQHGYNASIEMNLFEHYSEVQAQMFHHRVSCSPSRVLDRNTEIILDVDSVDKKKKVTGLKLTWKNGITGEECVLGHIKIYVGDIIKKEWYTTYRKKKFKRMELLNTHGFASLKEPEFGHVALEIWRRLYPYAISKLNMKNINSERDEVCRQEGLVYSILLRMEISEKASLPLELYHDMHKFALLLERAKTEYERAERRKKIVLSEKQFRRALGQLNFLEYIYREYSNIDGEEHHGKS